MCKEWSKDTVNKKNENIVFWSRQILIILLTAIVTTFANQLYYKQNIAFQARIELKKELLLRQCHIYNRLRLLSDNFKIDTISGEYDTQIIERHSVIMDRYLNPKGTQIKLNPTLERQYLKIVAPTFMWKDATYDLFVANLDYIKQNTEDIEPQIYKTFERLFDFLHEHPIPTKDKRMQEIYLSGWNDEKIYREFESIITELYRYYQNRLHENL